VEPRSEHVPWTQRRHRYARDELTLSLTQSLQGYGPDRYSVQPAEHIRFAVQLVRRMEPVPTLLASIPVGSRRERRVLLDHGWERTLSGRTGYYVQSFVAPEAAAASIVDAYTLVYGSVGDELGWNIVTQAFRPRPIRWRGPWTGEEDPVRNADERPAPKPWEEVEPRGSRSIPARTSRAISGVAIGLLCTWAALQSFVSHYGWAVGMPAIVLVAVGSVLLASLVAISPLPDAVARRTESVWGDSIMTRALLLFSFGALPAIAWSILVIRVFGTPP